MQPDAGAVLQKPFAFHVIGSSVIPGELDDGTRRLQQMDRRVHGGRSSVVIGVPTFVRMREHNGRAQPRKDVRQAPGVMRDTEYGLLIRTVEAQRGCIGYAHGRQGLQQFPAAEIRVFLPARAPGIARIGPGSGRSIGHMNDCEFTPEDRQQRA